jgi:signal transduction histidine kinase
MRRLIQLLLAGFVLLLVGAGDVIAQAERAHAAQRQQRVLVLYTLRRDAQLAFIGERQLQRTLQTGVIGGVDYYSEFMDQARFPDPQYREAFRTFLRIKYEGHSFDLVIAMTDLALQFIGSNRSELFPGVPIVFFARLQSTQRVPNSTGLYMSVDYAGTVALAARLQPDLEHVFFVAGAEDRDREYERIARAQFRSYEPRLSFTYFTGLPTRELEARLSKLPPHSMVYYVVVNRDGTGENFHPLEYLDRISARANAPVYSWVNSAIGHGIVGGKLRVQDAEIAALGQLALRVLRGEAPDGIPPAALDSSVIQIDWRQLRRWGIDGARVPTGAVIMFREPSVWDRYRIYILGAFAIVLAQSALIAGLLVQRARRRQAEDQVRGSQAELQTSYERIRDLGARLLNAQEMERARIARELHDDISQQLAVLEIDVELLTNTAKSDDGHLAGDVLTRIHSIAKSVRDLSHRLHPARLRLVGLLGALQGLREEMSQPGIDIILTHENVPPTLSKETTLCLFRVVQEGLQNALKYSGSRRVIIDLRAAGDALVLTILDDGAGFDVDTEWGHGLGLMSMRERLDAVGGTFEIHSAPGTGTRLEAVVPLREAKKLVAV